MHQSMTQLYRVSPSVQHHRDQRRSLDETHLQSTHEKGTDVVIILTYSMHHIRIGQRDVQHAPYPNWPNVAPMYSPALVPVTRHSCEPSMQLTEPSTKRVRGKPASSNNWAVAPTSTRERHDANDMMVIRNGMASGRPPEACTIWAMLALTSTRRYHTQLKQRRRWVTGRRFQSTT